MPLRRRWGLYAIVATCILLAYHHYQSPINGWALRDRGRNWKSQAGVKWSDIPTRYPVSSMALLPRGEPLKLPTIQHTFPAEPEAEAIIRKERQMEVRSTFQKCWASYKRHAWLRDELAPISGGYKDSFGGWAATLVDALDTLWIMDLQAEFEEAVAAVARIDFGKSALEEINVFETTIRYLGGLLSAYDLSGERILLDKAKEVGEMVYVAFDTPNRMPITRWNFHKAASGERHRAHSVVLVAEIGSMTLEFTRLSQVTGDPKWYDAVLRIMEVFTQQQNQTNLPGMWPIVVNAEEADFTKDSAFTLGAMSDSLYEYFSKTYALLGGLVPMYRSLYEISMATAIEHVLYRPMVPDNADILLSGNVRAVSKGKASLDGEGQHLVCFAGGMLALGGRLFMIPEHVEVGRKLVDGCIHTYKTMPTGIMPEVFHMVPCLSKNLQCTWDESKWKHEVARKANLGDDKDVDQYIVANRLPAGVAAIRDRRYILRPEAIESVFVLYRITGRKDLLESAWDMFTAVQKHTQTHLANAALADVTVTNGPPPQIDSMEVSSDLQQCLNSSFLCITGGQA